MTNEGICILSAQCKKAGKDGYCNNQCYPFLKAHGNSGKGGLVGAAEVPKAYERSLLSNLPIKNGNSRAYTIIKNYIENLSEFTGKGVGLYLYSVPNKDNPKGTGTGKTTASAAILNEYLITRIISHIKKEEEIKEIPTLFVNVSKLQNKFNMQFRGTLEIQQSAGQAYYSLKYKMLKVDLLVLDDIGVRDATPSFLSELYEIIDERASERKATILSSNLPLTELTSILDDRITSRIEGCTVQIPFEGKDYRKGGH